MKESHPNFIGFTLLFFLFWVAVSGSFHWHQLLAGAAAALFVAYFNRDLLIKPAERPPVNLKTLFWLTGYVLRLLFEIVRANFQVARLVLSPRMPICPQWVTLVVDLKRTGSLVLLGNSITLTPGTLTVMAEENKFVIHTLTTECGEGLSEWDLIKKLKQMEGAVS